MGRSDNFGPFPSHFDPFLSVWASPDTPDFEYSQVFLPDLKTLQQRNVYSRSELDPGVNKKIENFVEQPQGIDLWL